MTEQTEALRLADALQIADANLSLMDDSLWVRISPSDLDAAAAELRRLHAENAQLLAALEMICAKCRGNEWGPDTPRKEILAWFHDFAAKELT